MNVSAVSSRVQRAFDYIETGTVYLGIILFICINVLAAFQIFMRFIGGDLLSISTVWTEELARYLLVIMVFVGAPYAMRNDDNISIRPLFRLVPPTAQRVLITFSNVLVIVFAALVLYSVSSVVERTLNVTLATINWLNVGYAHLILGIMFGLVILFAIEATIEVWTSDEPPMTEEDDNIDVPDEDMGISGIEGGE